MRRVVRNFLDTEPDFSLSPEHWLSIDTARGLSEGTPLRELVKVVSRTTIPKEGARFVLDTSNARDGLLELPVLGEAVSGRTSAKKTAREGDVIVSRLRPYLRQVALIPDGTAALLGQDEFFCSTEFFVLRSHDPQHASGIVGWLLSEPIQSMLSEAATGGHHPRIGVDLILDAPVEDRYLDAEYSGAVSRILRGHVEGQRELAVLLRH